MDAVAGLERVREFHRRSAWADACAVFGSLDRVNPLGIDDLERWGEAAHILGRCEQAVSVLQRVYQGHVDAGAVGGALRCAFWLWHALTFKGEFAHAGGWIARAGRLAETGPGCAERGYLLIPQAEQRFGGGDYATAFAVAGRAVEMGNQGGDRDLVTVAAHIQGRARIRAGQAAEGLALLDETMVGIAAGETSVRVSSWIYCSVIDACYELDEVRRAREWTVALNAWCDARGQFTGAFSGVCRIHRSELLQLAGEWPDAVREAQRACEQLTRGYGEILAGAACYQLGEIHRLCGDSVAAEEAYSRASQYGWQTQPGLALLRLAQGRVDDAVASIRRVLGETTGPLPRAKLLPGFVEIMLAAEDITAASDAATELAEIVEAYDTVGLHARLAYARGAVHLAGGSPEPALPALRQAWRLWHDLDVPYEVARARVLVGLACRALHDEDTAEMELDAARQVFARLGAAPDLRHVETLTRERAAGDTRRLSPREVEVLRLVAAGRTNQSIAAELFLSDRTVGRHVSNIFGKLGVSSRTAAAAYAFDHGIR